MRLSPLAMHRLLLLTAALFVSACSAAEPDDVRAGASLDTAQIAEGETATVAGVEVTFVEVVSDSRCPDTAVCVWAGEARVGLLVGADDRYLRTQARVVGAERQPEAGVRVGDQLVFVTALTPAPTVEPSSATPVVTVEVTGIE